MRETKTGGHSLNTANEPFSGSRVTCKSGPAATDYDIRTPVVRSSGQMNVPVDSSMPNVTVSGVGEITVQIGPREGLKDERRRWESSPTTGVAISDGYKRCSKCGQDYYSTTETRVSANAVILNFQHAGSRSWMDCAQGH